MDEFFDGDSQEQPMFPIMPRRNGEWNECSLELSSRLWRDPEPKKRVCRNALEEILPPTKITPAAAASTVVVSPFLPPFHPLDLPCRMIFTSQKESEDEDDASVASYSFAQRRFVILYLSLVTRERGCY